MAVIATAGHVDHGKSSLVLALTGTDPDRLAEEKRKGMTIDLGFAHCVTPNGTSLSFVDVPGHADFIRTMIAGVSGVDIAMLIVDAHEGWMPQTQEHLDVLQLLNIRTGVVVITKSDKATDIELRKLEEDIRERLTDSSIHWTSIMNTSVVTHKGVPELLQHLSTLLEDVEPPTHARPIRLFIDRVFTIRGSGTVVTGTLEGESVSIGDVLHVARTGQEVRVREVQTLDSSVQTCEPRSRCALNIVGVDGSDLHRGDALMQHQSYLMTSVIDVRFTAVPTLKRPMTHRGSFTLHIGTNMQSVTARIAHASSIRPGETATIRLRFAQPLPLAIHDHVVLRDTGIDQTVGGGHIINLDPHGPVRFAHTTALPEDILQQRGFLSVAQARLLTGQNLQPTIGSWYALPSVYNNTVEQLNKRIDTEQFITMTDLAAYEQDIVRTLKEVVVHNGVAARAEQDPLLNHEYIALFRQAGLLTPDAASLDRNIIRQLVQRKILFEHDNIAFHADTLNDVRPELHALWQLHPEGFTMAQLRDALGITRKHALPLANCLDKVGLTKRNDDVRLPGHAW